MGEIFNKDNFNKDNPLSYKPVPEDPFVLDFSRCRYLGEVHQVLREGLGLPDYYGENWDALWDLLYSFRPYPVVVEVRGLGRLPKQWQGEIEQMKRVFDDVHKQCAHITFRYVS
ncbi:barstar family protein [Ruminococcaceae bacterium OttesenSCG-928-I18]|nr:barstar family protein [Ruminococcaceae bacterium OttesenSCG-928-I18]